MMVFLAELVDAVSHVGDDLESQLLRFLRLAMVLADESYEAFRQSDESDSEGTLVNDGLDGLVRFEVLASNPEALHEQRELLCERCLLEIEPVVELPCRHVEHVVRHQGALLGRGLGGADVHAAVDLHGVGRDDLAVVFLGEGDAEAGLARGRRAADNDDLWLHS